MTLNLRFEFGQLPSIDKNAQFDAHMSLISDHLGEQSLSSEKIEKLALATLHSPYLTSLIRRHPEATGRLLNGSFDDEFDNILATLAAPRPGAETDEEFISFLRVQKNCAALLIGLGDLLSCWRLEKTTECLTKIARACLEAAVARALRLRMHAGDLPWPTHTDSQSPIDIKLNTSSGFFILALGKMGASELNYSSDIDLIVLYDAECIHYTGRKSLSDCFVKLTQDVVKFMEQRTFDGYVFRVDLRLRPDPGATPVALPVEAALGYYHSIAANWERSAMIKASFAAGDHGAANQYLRELESWVWRKNMDFEALKEIGAIKNQINRHFDVEDANFAGFDVKLGLGGIREIEFYAQINQLLHAGRNPSLRTKGTIETLNELARLGLAPANLTEDLAQAYKFLRVVEHRIQMVNDEQTHSIPNSPDALNRLSRFLGYSSTSDFEHDVITTTKTVKTHYDAFLPDAGEDGMSVSDEQLVKWLDHCGLKDKNAAFETINAWKYGRYRALKTARARSLLNQCLPELLASFSKAHSPDSALVRFDTFLSQLPAGVQLFSLLQANPTLLGLLARVISLAPALANMLAKNTGLWDLVLGPHFFAPPLSKDALREEISIQLSTARDYQDVLDIVRRFAAEQKFRTGVLMLEGIASVAEIGDALSDMADVILSALIPVVEKDFASKHGAFPGSGKGLAVFALGKYGGRELTHTSDLDIVFIYEGDVDESYSDGPKPLSPNVYYTRLAQHIITAITALTPEGRLFEVDTRLRPSGNQGPLAVSSQSFKDYYGEGAWVWEFMALTRGRIVYGPRVLAEKIEKIAFEALCRGPKRDNLAKDVLEIRAKLANQFAKDNMWDVKQVRGGLVDIEFVCQFLALRYRESLDMSSLQSTSDCLLQLFENGAFQEADYQKLLNAFMLQRTLQALLRLCLEHTPKDSNQIPAGLIQVILENTYFDDVSALEEGLCSAQQEVIAQFSANLV